MESGPDGPVSELITFEEDLIAGGRFDMASGNVSENIARWVESPSSVEEGEFAAGLVAFPNPASTSEIHVSWGVEHQGPGTLFVYDVAGRVALRQVVVGYGQEPIKVGSLPVGSYSLVWRRAGHAPVSTRVVVLR
jgi:hypothetical protein